MSTPPSDGGDQPTPSPRRSGGDDRAGVLFAVLDELREPIVLAEAGGDILYVNPALVASLQLDQDDLVGRSINEFLHASEVALATPELSSILERQRQQVSTYRVLCGDGSYRHFDIYGSRVDAIGAEPRILLTLHDVSERVRQAAGLAVRLRNEDLAASVASRFVHVSPDAFDLTVNRALSDASTVLGGSRVFVLRVHDDVTADGLIHTWDSGADGPPTDLVVRSDLDPLMSELDISESVVLDVGDDGTDWIGFGPILQSMGISSLLFVAMRSEQELLGCVGADVTGLGAEERNEHVQVLRVLAGVMAQALARRESEERYALAFTRSPDPMFLLDARGRYLEANQAFADMVGSTPEELVGTVEMSWIHPDDTDSIANRWYAMQAAETETSTLEYRCIRPDGTVRWLSSTASAFRDGRDGIKFTVVHQRDITEQRQQEHDLRASQAHLQAMVDNSPAVLTRIGRDRSVVFMSRRFTTVTGIDSARYEGKHYLDAPVPAALRVELEPAVDAAFELGRSRTFDWFASVPAHPALWLRSLVAPERSPDGEIDHVLVLTTDVTHEKEAEARLLHQASHDSLTGLPNRDHLHLHLTDALARAERVGTRVAVVFLDVDRFKLVNDSLGHEAGDELLQQVAERLDAKLRANEFVARLGGDEFVVVLEGLADDADALAATDRLRRALLAPTTIGGIEVVTTASLGIAVSVTDDVTVDRHELLRRADVAMYRAKTLGRNRTALYDSHLHESERSRLETEVSLRHALEAGELVVHYQPELDLRSGEIVGAEALVRWDHPAGHRLEAAEFVPVAEESELIIGLGTWVLRQACHQAGEWFRERGEAPFVVRVNLSARQVTDPDLVSIVGEALRAAQLPASHLCLEITETTLMDDAPAALGVLERLRALGVRLAIDDFGTGYSSLSYLKRFPVDVLKIDGSFVDGLGYDVHDTAIARTIVDLARSLGLETVGECVESQEQLDVLRRLGCDRAQGHLISRAVAAADFRF